MDTGAFSYQVIFSARRTLAIQVTPDAKVLVRCPTGFPREMVAQFVERKSHWIEKQLQKVVSRPQLPPFTQEELRTLRQQALEWLPPRVGIFAEKMGVTYGKVTVGNQRSQWGSCSSKGNLSFNCLVMLAPEQVRDYVIVHELCHRRQMNHSPGFWEEVEKVLPDYPQRRRWLKEHGSALMGRLP